MKYIYDAERDYYIIKINKKMDNALFQKAVNSILKEEELANSLYCYYTFFNQDYTYCILDFNRRNLSDIQINNLISKNTKTKGR